MNRFSDFKVGDRVRLTEDAERYPHFIAPKGATGVITHWSRRNYPGDESPDFCCVKLDVPVEGSEEWDGEVHWFPYNCDQEPWNELERVT